MSSPAPALPLPAPPFVGGARRDHLGPGVLTAFEGVDVVVELSDGRRVTAQMALGYPYRPRLGDALLVIGQSEEGASNHYVIGVLHGTGRAVLEIPGDVELRAVGGELTLSGDAGVRVRGPSLDVTVERVEILAERVVETCATLFQRVRQLLTVHAKESQTTVDGHAATQAESATILTEQKMLINGKQIHLG